MTSLNYTKKWRLIVLILLFLSAGCTNNNTPPDNSKSDKFAYETQIFDSYLKKQFNVEIKDSLCFYFKIPSEGCIGCIKKMYDFIKSDETFKTNNCYAIISVTSTAEAMDLLHTEKVMADMDNNIDKLNIYPYTPALIITNNKLIINILPLDADDDAGEILKQKIISKGL